MAATLISAVRLPSRRIFFAAMLVALTILSIGHTIKHCRTASLAVSPEIGKEFAQWFTYYAINYHQSMASHEDFTSAWADRCAAEKIKRVFALQGHCQSDSIEFVPSNYWEPESRNDGTLKIQFTGHLIDLSGSKIKSLPLKVIYKIRREKLGYRIYNVKAQYIKAGDIERFLQLTAKQSPSTSNKFAVTQLRRGQSYRQAGQWTLARQCFTDAIKANPDFACAYRLRADCQNNLQDKNAAKADIDKAITIGPEEWSSYFNRAYITNSYSKQNFEDYSRVIKMCPGFPYAYINRAQMQEQFGTVQAADDDYNKFIDLEPKNSIGYSGKADLEQRTGNLLGAYLDCNRAIDLNPQDHWAYYTRGLVRQKFFDSTGAIEDLRKSGIMDLR